MGQALQCLSFAAHKVVALRSCDVIAALAEVKVHRWFVPVQDGEVDLVAAGSHAQLQSRKTDMVT